ncbi:hypothetical protein, partial [Staphylococcus aureus]|uniref:hypothetical protein n=1 Tax=Staphylococcus aureus TaxID=1280 RepID=UPI0038B2D8D9
PKEETMEVRFATTKPKASYFTDDDSAGSSEEVESPRSVGRWRRPSRKVAYVHSQILRIREEDSHLGESSFAVKERISAAV